MKNLLDFLKLIDEYQSYLIARGQAFSPDGWPMIDKKCFLDKPPDIIVPFLKRTDKRLQCYKSIAICSFSKDENIYPRLDNLMKDIEEYKKFAAVVALDLTVTWDMDKEWQDVILLVNRLFMAILAINGIKVIINTRIGSTMDFSSLQYLPHMVMCASGFLGCAKAKEYDMTYLAKILFLRPSWLLIYGKCSDIERANLDRFGIKYIVYIDYHKWSKTGGVSHVRY